MVNRKIFLVGFGLYGSIDTPAEYSVNIQVSKTFWQRYLLSLCNCLLLKWFLLSYTMLALYMYVCLSQQLNIASHTNTTLIA